MNNYSELVDAVSNWLNHEEPGTLDRIPTFIRLAELRVGRDLRTLRLQAQLEYTVTQDDEDAKQVPLPSDYNGMVAVAVNSRKLEQLSIDQYLRSGLKTMGGSNQIGYAVIGDNMVIGTPVGKDAVVNFIYYALPPKLGASQQAGPLLTYYGDMLLYGALAEAMPYLKDEKRLPNFANLYQSALTTVIESDARMRMEDSPQIVTSHYQGDSNNYRSNY